MDPIQASALHKQFSGLSLSPAATPEPTLATDISEMETWFTNPALHKLETKELSFLLTAAIKKLTDHGSDSEEGKLLSARSIEYVKKSETNKLPRSLFIYRAHQAFIILLKSKGSLPVVQGGNKRSGPALLVSLKERKVWLVCQLVTLDSRSASRRISSDPPDAVVYKKCGKSPHLPEFYGWTEYTKRKGDKVFHKTSFFYKYYPYTLRQYLDTKEFLKISVLKDIIQDILNGLQTLYAQGLIYGDLKASNILIEKTKGKVRALISDFDYALKGNGTKGMNLLYYIQPRFTPPEVLRKRTITDMSQADIYALGGLLYEILLQTSLPWQKELIEYVKQVRIAKDREGVSASHIIEKQEKFLEKAKYSRELFEITTSGLLTVEILNSFALALLHPNPTERPDIATALQWIGKFKL